MSTYRHNIIIILMSSLVFTSSQSLFADMCSGVFNTKNPSSMQVKFVKFPELGLYVQQILQDPFSAVKTKKLVRWFIESESVVLKKIEDPSMKVALDEIGVQSYETTNIKNFDVGTTLKPRKINSKKALNETVKERVSKSLGEGYYAELHLPEMDNINIQFSYFVHELSHARFDIFLEKNIQKIKNKLSSLQISNNKQGLPVIDTTLYNYLTERYAYQTEYEVLRAENQEHYLDFIGKQKTDYKLAIEQFVVENYLESKKNIKTLRKKSINAILLGR